MSDFLERFNALDIEDPVDKLYWQMKKVGYKGRRRDVADHISAKNAVWHEFALKALDEMEKPDWFYPPEARAQHLINEIEAQIRELFPDSDKSVPDVLYEQSQKRGYNRSYNYYLKAFEKPKARSADTCWAILIGLQSDMGVF